MSKVDLGSWILDWTILLSNTYVTISPNDHCKINKVRKISWIYCDSRISLEIDAKVST